MQGVYPQCQLEEIAYRQMVRGVIGGDNNFLSSHQPAIITLRINHFWPQIENIFYFLYLRLIGKLAVGLDKSLDIRRKSIDKKIKLIVSPNTQILEIYID